MALKRVQKSSLVQEIVEQIEGSIMDGSYAAGDKLPAIHELQEIVGASQGTLREALRILQQKGLIEIRLGVKGGAYIRESSTETVSEGLALLIRQRRITYEELADFRKVVEAGMIRLVAGNVTPKEVAGLKRYLIKMRTFSKKGADGWQKFLDVEVALRKELIRLSKNRMYEAVLVPLHENIFAYSRDLLNSETSQPDKAYQDWQEIIAALADGDADAAAAITVAHIERYVKILKSISG